MVPQLANARRFVCDIFMTFCTLWNVMRQNLANARRFVCIIYVFLYFVVCDEVEQIVMGATTCNLLIYVFLYVVVCDGATT